MLSNGIGGFIVTVVLNDLFEQIPQLTPPHCTHVKELSELNWKDVPGHCLNVHFPDKIRSLFYDVIFMPYNSPEDFGTIVTTNRKNTDALKAYVYKENCFCLDRCRGNYGEIFRPKGDIQERIHKITAEWNGHVVGLHVRRTDNRLAVQNSPIERYDQIIEDEIKRDS